MSFLEEIENQALCGDGAMETLLHERGAAADECLEALCISSPDLVREIHADYVNAGAHIIRTNTFGANAVELRRHGLSNRVNEINWQAAQLSRLAAKEAFVAGRVGPLGISSAEAEQQEVDREECFRMQIGALLEGGVDLIVLENFQDMDELLIALHVKQSLHHCPAICSLAVEEDGLLPGSVSLEFAFKKLIGQDAEMLGINCIADSKVALRLAERVLPSELPLAVYAKARVARYCYGRNVDDLSPEAFAHMGLALAQRGVRIIGGCRGTTPAHIAVLSKALADVRGDVT
jgi:methionine synthase / methylenetetrahydrofolate reductase (NADH)